MLDVFRQRVKKVIAGEKHMPWNLQDIFPTSASPTTHDLDIYIWLVRETCERPWSGGAHPSATIVDSVKLYRRTADTRDTLVICQLRHPACHGKPISLVLERFPEGANPGEVASAESPASGRALDRAIVTTTKFDITHSSLLYRTLTFPTSKPTLFDLLALAESLSARNRAYTVIDGSCIFYGGAIYSALQRIFDGRSEDNPGCEPVLPPFLSMLNTYERKIDDVVNTFPTARLEFERTAADARLTSMGTSILKAQLPAGFRRQLDVKLAALKDQKDAELAALQKKKEARISFRVGGEKYRAELDS
ncbi:hypothetical protein K438DRAFT_1943536 [Mycena galopus ATCC 62051]|nr:hypothetical protein K438DRAFT_1943536 [Mycena galopus ATCC 62051]